MLHVSEVPMRRTLLLSLVLAGCEPDAIDMTKGIGVEGDVVEGSDGLTGDGDGDDGGADEDGEGSDGLDTDGDGISDDQELDLGTDPTDADTDGDGISDGDEADLGTDPTDADSDGDGISDDRELDLGTDPLDADTDDDGLADGDEVDRGTDPLDDDTDADALLDGDEVTAGSDLHYEDTDLDGLLDGEEVHTHGTDPTLTDTDGGGRTDGEEVFVDGTDVLDGSDDISGSSDDPGLLGGEIDVDVSSSIADWTSGDTDGHVHQYDDDNDLVFVDFFDLGERKLDDFAEVVDASQPFKLIVANADLSPAGRVVLNVSYDEEDPTTWTDVDTYDDSPLADLTVYTLDGSSGTTQLTSFGVAFHHLALASGGVHNTETSCVRDNDPGAYGEWRNGALTLQAVAVDSAGNDDFTTDTSYSSGGVQGVAT